MSDNSQRYSGLSLSQVAYVVSREFVAQQRPWLIVCADRAEADRLVSDIEFFFNGSSVEVFLLPRWEVLPFDVLSPAAEVMGERISALGALAQSRSCIVVTTIDALMQKVISPDVLTQMMLRVSLGQVISRDELVEKMIALGYVRSSIVEEFGQVSARGSVVDMFSAQSSSPIRIEFFGDEIESIRYFDSQSQRSTSRISSFEILPAREFTDGNVIDENNRDDFIELVRQRAMDLQLPSRVVAEIVEALNSNVHYEGVEHLLPLMPNLCVSLIDTFAPSVCFVSLDSLAIGRAADNFAKLVVERELAAKEKGQLFVKADAAYLGADKILEGLTENVKYAFDTVSLIDISQSQEHQAKEFVSNSKLQAELIAGRRLDNPFQPMADHLSNAIKNKIPAAIVVNSRSRRARLEQILTNYKLPVVQREESFSAWQERGDFQNVALFHGDLSGGFKSIRDSFLLVSEREIFPDIVTRNKSRLAASIKRYAGKLASLKVDDFIVHVDHGIGFYRGLKQIKVQEVLSDFLELEYAEGAKLFLPVENIGKIQKYSASEGVKPSLHRLGGGAWVKTKRKVKSQVAELAGELLRLYAKREVSPGTSYPDVEVDDLAFADTFEYEPTVDQVKAIEDVQNDLSKPQPMDRLVCGDVGYGKTEVALRAAFKVANSGKQVAILVPTTVLADQHYKTFCERYSSFPLEVRGLSRFFTPAENKETVEMLRRGQADIVIGTHRLLQKDIVFKDLGLVVIDEEHRFGVAAKEKLKKLRTSVDILTLTATPIPRTLHMSMVGIKDLSVIESPPVDRQAIRTYIVRMDEQEESVVRDAILRELGRDGQVFYIHNRVQSIAGVAAGLRELVPEARIEFAHGQMKERELEKVMHRFIQKEFDVLVSTTIVESGLDIPNANTMVIRQAERFGLAELYQLRGRVGRSARRAHAYLLVGNPTGMTRDAKKRLEVLQALDDLGIGFRLALQDMEIRGAGNLLGKDQSGHIMLVGFEMYMRLLQETIESMRYDQVHDPLRDIEPEMNFGFAAHIPAFYIPDVSERIFLYQRLVGLRDSLEVATLAEEIEDRFGRLPLEVEELLSVMKLRSLLRFGFVVKASKFNQRMTLNFHPEARIDSNAIVRVVKNEPKQYRRVNETTFSITLKNELSSPDELIDVVLDFFEKIGLPCTSFTKKNVS